MMGCGVWQGLAVQVEVGKEEVNEGFDPIFYQRVFVLGLVWWLGQGNYKGGLGFVWIWIFGIITIKRPFGLVFINHKD